MQNLSPRQIAALAALGNSMAYRFAADLGVSAATLSSLVRLGLAENRWFVSSLREPDKATYRSTGRGAAVSRKLNKVTVS